MTTTTETTRTVEVRNLAPGDVVYGPSIRGNVLALLDDPSSRWSDILDASYDHKVETATRQQDGSTLVHMVRGDGERTMLRPYDHDRTVEVIR